MSDDRPKPNFLAAARAIEAAERSIEHHIRPHREPMRRIFASLEPLEAIALLGYITAETIERFPPDERANILAALCDELQAPPDA
jgi:hypothetical protein